MKYEITETQMAELSKILQDLNNINAVFRGQRGSGFMQDTATRLYGLVQRIEMQDVEDAFTD